MRKVFGDIVAFLNDAITLAIQSLLFIFGKLMIYVQYI